MNLEVIEQRVKQLEEAVERCVVNHNVTLGQLGEAKYLLEMLKNSVPKTEEAEHVVQHVAETAEQVIDTTASN